MKELRFPFTEQAVRSLKAGEAVSLSGLVLTGRDKFHKFFADGHRLPVDLRNGALYHCGPVIVKVGADWQVKAAGPTTSVRENPYEPELIAKTGLRVVIGKGGMDAATLKAMQRYGCVYLQAVGGAAALAAAAVKRVVGVTFLKEFGAAEACWHLELQDFRCIVAMDAHARSLFDEVRRDSAQWLNRLIG